MQIKLFLVVLFSTFTFSQELITITIKDDIKENFLLNEAKNSKAVAILFSGGSGKLKLEKEEYQWNLKNFLIRSRNLFNENNITTICIDSPTNLKEGMINGFRTSKEHLQNIINIINYIKNRFPNLPIWLIGTSMGTISATYNTINQKHISGLILTSSVSIQNRHTEPVINLDLEKISIPTLIVHHKNDNCKVTPLTGAKDIFNKLINTEKKEIKIFEGGYENGKPCKSQSYHGYLGIEEKVVEYISSWIKSH